MINLIGTSINHYQILVKIRETPTRILFRAHNTRSHTDVALEVVKTAWLDPHELLDMIDEQARKNAELVHPNIATVADTGFYDGLIYIVYNFYPRQPLQRFFGRTYPWKEMSRELVSIAHALAYAHEKDVVHGALHPASIILDEKRNPILFDFGFEHILSDYILSHAPGSWINRWGLEYRAPAQLNGVAPDKQSDIYSLGIMLYEWLTGRIHREEATFLGRLQLKKKPIVMGRETTTVPPVVKDLVNKCISLNPAERYQSMQEVYIVLARGALDMALTTKMVRKPMDITAPRFKLKRSQTRLIGFVILLMVLALVTLLNRSTLYEAITPATPTPSPTTPPSTATPTSRPTNTLVPTKTAIPPTATPLGFPVYQGTQLSNAVNRSLDPDNIDQMVMLSIWGMGDINRLVSSPNGKYLAAATSIGIFVFSTEDLTLERYIDTSSSITTVGFSSDGKLMASGDSIGLIQVWETETWTKSNTSYSGHRKAILDLAFSPKGTKLVSVDTNSRLFQWHINPDNDPKPNYIDIVGGVTSLTYSNDGTLIVTGGNDLLLNVWDAETLTYLQKEEFSGKIVDMVPMKGQDRLFLIGGNDQRVALLNLSGLTKLQTIGYLRYPLTSVAASPDGGLIAAGDLNGGIAEWELNGEEIKQVLTPKSYTLEDVKYLESPGSPHSLTYSSDGKLVFSGLHNGTLRAVDAVTGQEVRHNTVFNAHVKKMAVSHNSMYLITQQVNDSLTMWDLWRGRTLYQLQGEIRGSDPFSQDDQKFAISSSGPNTATVYIHEPANGNEIFTLKGRPRLKTIQFVHDSTQLITVYDGIEELWSMSSGQKIDTNPQFDGTGCQAIRDKDLQTMVSITKYQYIVTNNINRSGLCIFEPQNFKFAVNEEKGLLLYGGESILALANVRNPEQKDLPLEGVNQKNITSVAISPNGDLVAAAYDDYSIHIWNALTQKELTNPIMGLYGHRNVITSLQFAPNGRLLLSGSLDGTLRLWGVPY